MNGRAPLLDPDAIIAHASMSRAPVTLLGELESGTFGSIETSSTQAQIDRASRRSLADTL
jgi:hypothetical protein